MKTLLIGILVALSSAPAWANDNPIWGFGANPCTDLTKAIPHHLKDAYDLMRLSAKGGLNAAAVFAYIARIQGYVTAALSIVAFRTEWTASQS